jgi:predicted fused transcriptional regulator/phosphomethylpyrimidine kinase
MTMATTAMAAVIAVAPVPVALVPAIPPSIAAMIPAMTAVITVAAVIGRVAVVMDASGQKRRQGKKRQDRG